MRNLITKETIRVSGGSDAVDVAIGLLAVAVAVALAPETAGLSMVCIGELAADGSVVASGIAIHQGK